MPSSGRYTPTCSLCGKQHWPLDPSCLGKKGAKARAKAKAEAKRQAKLQAKAEKKARLKAPKDVQQESKNNEEAQYFADKIANIKFEAQKAMADSELQAEDALTAERRKWSKIQAQSEQRIQSHIEEVAQVKSEMDEAILKEQAGLKKQAEEKLEIQAEADAAVKRITDMLISSKESLRVEVEIRVAAEKQLEAEMSKRKQLETDAIEKNKSHTEEVARLRSEASESKTITEARLKKKLQKELELRTMLQTEVRAKIKTFVKQIDTLKAHSTRTKQENKAKAEDAKIDNVTFEDTDVSREIDIDVSGNMTSRLLAIKAQDIMLHNIAWASPDDRVRDVFKKIQAATGEYLIIGNDDIADGIVSKSYLKGIASPYLRFFMAKWKQDQNDALLDIEIKWLMNRQMQTISKDTSCTTIMKKMHQCGSALPVVDQNNKVMGLVTPFNVLKVRALLKLESAASH